MLRHLLKATSNDRVGIEISNVFDNKYKPFSPQRIGGLLI